jgi:hypothetical protein
VVTSASSFQDVNNYYYMHSIDLGLLTLLILFCELAMLARVRCSGVSVVWWGCCWIVGQAEIKLF